MFATGRSRASGLRARRLSPLTVSSTAASGRCWSTDRPSAPVRPSSPPSSIITTRWPDPCASATNRSTARADSSARAASAPDAVPSTAALSSFRTSTPCARRVAAMRARLSVRSPLSSTITSSGAMPAASSARTKPSEFSTRWSRKTIRQPPGAIGWVRAAQSRTGMAADSVACSSSDRRRSCRSTASRRSSATSGSSARTIAWKARLRGFAGRRERGATPPRWIPTWTRPPVGSVHDRWRRSASSSSGAAGRSGSGSRPS